ncbi:MAG: glutathione S-transferase family protein [Kamptonema sp. SIO4C4]|nr:glutathione S-transferase family protein [Kamptonema sp. SIO4C4]
MLKFYYHPLSPIARRVWITLLEKGLTFEPIIINLNGEQKKPEYLALNPFHHVPVLVDGELRILESLAILDYLEAQYPTPSLHPESPAAIAKMRMVQMVTINELTPKLPALVLSNESPDPDEATLQHLATLLNFLSEQLGDSAYFGGANVSLADITAGTAFPLMTRLGIELQNYPSLAAWYERIIARNSWQQTQLNEDAFQTWKRWLLLQIKRRQRQRAKAAT